MDQSQHSKNDQHEKAILHSMIGLISCILLLGCGGQDRTAPDPVAAAKNAPTTNIYADLNALFLSTNHPEGTIKDFIPEGGSGTFQFPSLPDFNVAPTKTIAFNYINLYKTDQIDYKVTLSPGWLYQIVVKEINNISPFNKQYFILSVNTKRQSKEVDGVQEIYTFVTRQIWQPQATDAVQMYLYFPETPTCLANQNCYQDIEIKVALDMRNSSYVSPEQQHFIVIDAISVSTKPSSIIGNYSRIRKEHVEHTVTNNEDQVANSDEKFIRIYDKQQARYLLIEDILFLQNLSPSRFSFNLKPEYIYQNFNPAPFWFATSYKSNVNNSGYYHHHINNISIYYSDTSNPYVLQTVDIESFGAINLAGDNLNWIEKMQWNEKIQINTPKGCSDPCIIDNIYHFEVRLTLLP